MFRAQCTRMAKATLFVRSEKLKTITEFHPGAYFERAHQEGTTEIRTPREDAEAKALLKRSGIDFELVDLSVGTKNRFTGLIRGVRKTPTLRTESGETYTGLNAISKYVSEARAMRSG